MDYSVTPTSEEHLPVVTNEKVEQATNNGLCTSDSEDYLTVHGDDDDDAAMENCESGNNSDISDDNDFDNFDAIGRYERNSEGFEYSMDADEKIKLQKGHTFFTMYDFRKILQVFAIGNGFRLQRLKNEKVRVTYKCIAEGCTWRIQASPMWDKQSFQIKTYNPNYSCKRIFDNWKASSCLIAAQVLHLFRANPNIDIKIIVGD